MATPPTIHHIDEIDSTQDEARRLTETTGTVPLLLIARHQSKGRGRWGRGWLAAPRALACSMVVRPNWPFGDWSRISLVAGLAARFAVKTVAGVEVGLKWPNDLLTESGKVGGVLVESSGDLAVVGLGVNLWWPDAPAGIAALGEDDSAWEVADAIAVVWAERLLSVLAGDVAHWGYEEYRAACVTLGSEIVWEPEGRGDVVDVATDGALVVETALGRVTLRSGEVRSVRPITLASRLADDRGDDAS